MTKYQAFLRIAFLFALFAGSTGRLSSAKTFQAAPQVLVPNLMAYWAADGDAGGMATDLSGNGNTGTYVSGATVAAASPGTFAGSMSYLFSQPSNQYINVPDSPSISLTGSFTLSAWVRRTADNASLQKGIIEKYDSAPLGSGYSLRIGQNEHYGFSVYSGTTQKGITTAGTSLPFRGSDLNTWNHVVGVYSSTTSPNMAIYKDGNKDATDSANTAQEPVAPPTNGSAALQIGKDYGANAFNGNIDEVRIFNRALTPAEILILRDGQAGATGLVALPASGQNNLTWTPAANATQYTVLRGTVTGVYTTAFNNITGTTYADITATPGVAYFYTVVAISVMAGPNSNESSATANPATPPPPPPPPRTQKVGNQRKPCGSGAVDAPSSGTLLLGIALLALALAPWRRRSPAKG